MARAAHRTRWIEATTLVVLTTLALACGDDGPPPPPEIVGGLRFVSQPDDADAFAPINEMASIEVEVVDETGVRIPDATDEVTLSLGSLGSPVEGYLILHASGWSDPNTTDLESRMIELVDPAIPALRYVLEKNWRLDAPTALAYDAVVDRALLTNRAIKNIYRVDPRSGESTLLGNGTVDWIAGLAFEPEGDERLLAVVNGNTELQDDALYEIDPDSGGLGILGTIVPDTGSIVFFSGLAIDPTDGTIFASAAMNQDPFEDGQPLLGHVLLTIDSETRVATPLGDMGTKIAGLATSPDGTLYAVTGGKATPPLTGETLMTVDPADGTLTQLMPPTGHGNDGNAITTVPPQLHGTVTVTAIDGVATFADPVMVDAIADGYTVVASATGRAEETSATFDVTHVAPAYDVDFEQPTLTVAEGAGSFDVVVRISRAPNLLDDTDVYATAGVGGTASDVGETDPDTDLDYLDYFQIVIPQDAISASRTVTIEDDTLVEGDETITFQLHDASLAAGFGANRTLVVTITDDDGS